MYFKDLKLAISIHFIVLLTIGMLLLNVVIISLWLKNIVSVSMDQGRSFLSIIVENTFSCEEKIVEFEEIQNHIHGFDADFLLYYNNELLSSEPMKSPEITRVMQKAIHSQSESIGTTGNFMSFFGMSAKDIIIARPIDNCSGEWAAGVVIHMEKAYKAILDKQSVVLVYLLVNVIILTTLGFFRMRRLIVKPLENLVNMAETFQASSDSFLTISPKSNEFGHVSAALHSMLSRIEKDKEKLNATIISLEKANRQILDNQNDLIEAEKFAAVGRLAAGLAHEIGNPLGIIQGYTDLLGKNDISDFERIQYASRSAKELERVNILIRQLLNFAGKKSDDIDKCNVTSVIREVVEMLQHQKSTSSILFDLDMQSSDDNTLFSSADLHQVLLNCLLNAIDAIQEKKCEGKISIVTSCVQKETMDYMAIAITDNGAGIDEKKLSSVFDPFFTTKEVGHGTGLGLSVSRSIVEKAGGRIHISSDGKSWTTVNIVLPAA